MENGDVIVNNPTFRKHSCDINDDNQYCDVTSSSSFDNEKVWTGLYRPRGALARALYYKQLSDRRLNEFDKNQWYACKLSSMPSDLVQLFHQLHADEDTLTFLDHSEQQSDWIFTQLWHAVAKLFLGIFMTQTSINGFLGRGSMFVISSDQFRALLDVPETWTGDSLLDLGAGNGAITAKFAPIFKQVYVTEVSYQMKNALNKQGFNVLEIDSWSQFNKYNVITCLNVLDRCDRPLEMLLQIRDSLTSNGKALIALVLPFKPYVEIGPADHKPAEELEIEGESFEQQVISFNNNVLSKIGFELIKWSKVPYLCEGDLNQAYYYLDDALFVIKRKSSES